MKRLFLVMLAFVASTAIGEAQIGSLIDGHATTETVNLFRNLQQLSGKQILFGHQQALEYGHGWQNVPNTSDIKKVTGSHPAVVGIDLMDMVGVPEAISTSERLRLQEIATATYQRGGVVTISWHARNPVDLGGFYFKDSSSVAAVRYIIPGGSHHQVYKEHLKQIATFAHQARTPNGTLVPMVFRPFHEYDGNWFWWGKKHCTASEFISLWKFTVAYLRDTLQVHNFIYAFSPDCSFTTEAEWLERFPGPEWVDMLGMDNYADFGRNGTYDVAAGVYKLQLMCRLARRWQKLAAFTETGLESIPNAYWWTRVLLPALQAPDVNLCYVLVWRNDSKSATHYYAPFKGQISEADFLSFFAHPFTLFEQDLPPLYTTPK
jgi:mannan endo-1,4-beta-mannosidase